MTKKRGSLIVSGDLGNSIATWFNPINPANLKKYVLDVGYYISKFQCSSNKYRYDFEDILADIKEYVSDFGFEIDEELWENVKESVKNSNYGTEFIPSKELIELISEFDSDYCEWLYHCGERVHIRVHLWAEGFNMACEQLGI